MYKASKDADFCSFAIYVDRFARQAVVINVKNIYFSDSHSELSNPEAT
jgi:hypothetical protein